MDKMAKMDLGQTLFSVYVGGSEINPYYLSRESAELIAQAWKSMGYSDVEIVEETNS